MKYWNKRRGRNTWIHVKCNSFVDRYFDAKLWCMRHESSGKFYVNDYSHRNWYFERADDALAFKLKYGY